MKKALVIVLLVTLFALFATSAAALTVGSATIGNSKQERVGNVTSTFTVTNNGTTGITGVTVSAPNVDLKYGIVFTPQTFNLTAGEVKTISVKGNIPLNHPAVEPDSSKSDYLEEKAFKIGDMVVNDGSTTTTASLNMQAANHIRIKSSTFYCGEKSTKLSDNAKVSDLKPDTSNCYLLVTVENTFRKNDVGEQHIGNVEFGTVNLEIEVDSEDFSVFETSTIDSLPADEYDDAETEDLSFDIDEDVKDKTYQMDLRVFGNDDNENGGAFHGLIWHVKLDVVRETYDIQIKDARMSPAKLDCRGGTLKLDANILNLGKRNDDEVTVEVDIPDLSINVKKTGIDLDADDSTGVTFAIKIPEDVAEGLYPVSMNTYFKGTALSNSKVFELAIEKCAVTEPVEDETPVVTPTTPATPTTPSNAVPAAPRARVSTEEFKESNTYLWLLGGIALVLAAAIIVVVIVFFAKKK